MGTREKLFRQKLAIQLETLLTHSEKVFSAEKLDQKWVSQMIQETQELTSVLTIYQFLHELPEDSNLQLEFLELQDQEKQKVRTPVPNYGDEILKEVEEFETATAQDVVIEEETIEIPAPQAATEEVVIPTPEPVVEPLAEPILHEKMEDIPVQVEPQEAPTIHPEPEPMEAEAAPIKVEPKKEVVSTPISNNGDDVVEINDAVALNATSLADKLRSKSILKLAESIALNERFLYANELFNGNMEAFKRALTELDHIASLDDATRFLEVQLMVQNNWDKDSSTVQQFIQLVGRRFN